MERVRFCPDPDCSLVWTNFTEEWFKKGSSFICVGIMKEPHIFIERETRHVNDCSFCIYTPLKGLIRFFYNKDDAWSDYVAMANLMKVRWPLQCAECGETSRLGITYYVKDDKYYCTLCYYRLGFISWHPEDRRYY